MPRWIGQLAYGYDPQNAPDTEEEPMTTFRILYTAVEYRQVEIEAESESAARQAFIDEAHSWGIEAERLDDTGAYELIEVDEV